MKKKRKSFLWTTAALLGISLVSPAIIKGEENTVNADGWKLWDADEVETTGTAMGETAEKWKALMKERIAARDSEKEVSEKKAAADHVDYYQFIHDEILPERGMASLVTAQKTLTSDDAWQNIGWSQKEGVLGADIADLDQDGADELLVYILEKKTDDTDGTLLKAEVYGTNENGEIEQRSWLNLAVFSEIGYERAKIGLMEKDGQVYLYKEIDTGSYFADGGQIAYVWYFLTEDNAFQARWSIGQSGLGGESSSAGSNCLADFYGPEEGDIQVLSTDGEFHVSPNWVGRPCDIYVLTAYGEYRASRPDEQILENSYSDNASAVRKGFGILGIDSMSVYDYSENKYDFESGYGPTLWDTGYMKESCSYECIGEKTEESWVRNMNITLEDRTGFRDKMTELD